MEIPASTLKELKCSVCEGYLSRGPVYLQQDSAAVCGVCFTPKCQATRNKQYEATAQLLLFPCKNQDLGCQVKLPFLKEAESSSHEEVCEYRQFVCPLLGSAHCDWIGTRTKILKHCEEQHADKVKNNNPTTLTHDISKSSDQTFLLRAFQLMFLLHVKICVTSGKIFHAIRYFGRLEDARNYTFNLDIKRNNEHISKKGRVAPQGCLSIQEDTSLVLDTNGLLSVLGGFDGTTFTVTVERLASVLGKCAKCNALITSFIYREEGDWLCVQCSPKKEECHNKSHNCAHIDILNKIEKHKFFCEKTSVCNICSAAVSTDSLYTHYNDNCTNKIEKINSGSTWRAVWTGLDDQKCIYSYRTKRVVIINKAVYYLLSSVAGIGMCKYWLENTQLVIHIFIPVTSERLREFKCVVRVTQTATGQTRVYTPETVYNQNYDWIVEAKNEDFTVWSHEFDVCVDIIKIGP